PNPPEASASPVMLPVVPTSPGSRNSEPPDSSSLSESFSAVPPHAHTHQAKVRIPLMLETVHTAGPLVNLNTRSGLQHFASGGLVRHYDEVCVLGRVRGVRADDGLRDVWRRRAQVAGAGSVRERWAIRVSADC